jgi:hypothetical protein
MILFTRIKQYKIDLTATFDQVQDIKVHAR